MNELFYLAKIGEINLKKGNLKDFERRLAQNFRAYFTHAALPHCSVQDAQNCGAQGTLCMPQVQVRAGRMYIQAPEPLRDLVEAALQHLFGITGWTHAKPVDKTLEAITQAAVAEAHAMRTHGAHTFKIEARRADKHFPLTSYDIAREVGGVIHTQGILAVDVHRPDAVISIEVREKQAFVYGATHAGRRGLPCGCSGRALLLLSGGIDSPVAGYRILFRGMKIDYVYFHSHPYTSPEAQQKVEQLAAILARYGLGGYLTIVSFTKVQQHLKRTVPEPYLTVLLRMCMMKTADMLAHAINAQCLVTGESLAQVASQTIENLSITDSCTQLPVLRPLIGMDKEEIIREARAIGTYQTSILPYEDCCVLFSPKHPVLHTKRCNAEDIFERITIEPLLAEAFEQRETKKIAWTLV